MKAKVYDANGNEVDEDGNIVRDGHTVKQSLLFLDGKGNAQTASQVLADHAAKVRADIDKDVYARNGMPVPHGSVAVLDAEHTYLPSGQRPSSHTLPDAVSDARRALVEESNHRLSNAWRNPPGSETKGE